ncbi:glyoxylate/hydroxypyruvate reductase HPR3 [Capsicum galapagoense]
MVNQSSKATSDQSLGRQNVEELPQLLILHPGPIFSMHESLFEKKFSLLKAWESPESIHHFLTTHAQSTRAILCSSVTPITAEILSLLPSLCVIACENTGVELIDLMECRKRGIYVTNAGPAFSQDVADMAVGLLLAVAMRIPASDRYIRARGWSDHQCFPPRTFKLRGKHVGIVGFGNIGSEVAKRLEAFGCKISYNSRKQKPSIPYEFYPQVIDLAYNCNVLIICCALTDQTRHMINRDVLKSLGENGIIVNVGRGPIIHERELVTSLMSREIAGAGLDVFENEPNVPNELFELDNVVLTPHRGAFTEEVFSNAFKLTMANLEAFFSNKPLISAIKQYD